MSNSKIAISKVLTAEGFILGKSIGYANDKDDNGGETVGGIAFKFWPNWKGWAIVNAAKEKPGFPASLVNSQQLYDLILEFYEVNFWNAIGGDGIKNQGIVTMLLKAAVHEGVTPAIKRAEILVHLPRTGKASDQLRTKLNLLP